MRKAITELNKGVLVSKSNLRNLNNKYIRIYLNACKNLYEHNFIDSPVIFNRHQFLTALLEDFPEVAHSLISEATMLMPMTIEYYEYIEKLYSDNAEISFAMKNYIEILEAEKIFKGINSFKYVKFGKRSDVKGIVPRINLSIAVKTKSKYMQDEFVNLYVLEHKGKVIKYDYTHVYIKYLMDDLNIKGYEEYRKSNKSVFLSDKFSFEDDCKYLTLLLNGDIISDTENGQKLYKLVKNFNSTIYDTYFNKLFIDAVEEINRETNEWRYTLSQYNPKEYYVTNNALYLEVSTYTSFINALGYEYYDYKVGSPIYDYDTGEPLSPVFRLLGYAGEFVSEEYAKSQELECNGLPVYLNDNKPYYPLFNVPEIADNYEKPAIYTNIDRNIIKDIDKYLIKDIDSSVNRYISTIVESLLCSYLDLETSMNYKAYEAEKLLDDSKSMYLERAILVYERMKDDYGIK